MEQRGATTLIDVSDAIQNISDAAQSQVQPLSEAEVFDPSKNVDKATLDTMDCGNLHSHGDAAIASDLSRTVAEAHRVLRPRGLYIVGTCRDWQRRKQTFDSSSSTSWELLSTAPLPKPPGDTTPDRQYVMVFRKA